MFVCVAADLVLYLRRGRERRERREGGGRGEKSEEGKYEGRGKVGWCLGIVEFLVWT